MQFRRSQRQRAAAAESLRHGDAVVLSLSSSLSLPVLVMLFPALPMCKICNFPQGLGEKPRAFSFDSTFRSSRKGVSGTTRPRARRWAPLPWETSTLFPLPLPAWRKSSAYVARSGGGGSTSVVIWSLFPKKRYEHVRLGSIDTGEYVLPRRQSIPFLAPLQCSTCTCTFLLHLTLLPSPRNRKQIGLPAKAYGRRSVSVVILRPATPPILRTTRLLCATLTLPTPITTRPSLPRKQGQANCLLRSRQVHYTQRKTNRCTYYLCT